MGLRISWAIEAESSSRLRECSPRSSWRWRVVVRAGSAARASALDRALWTWRDESFLPHGLAGDGREARQPILLTAGDKTPNDPQVLMLVDGARAAPDEVARFARTVLMFDGRDPDAVAAAREAWRETTAAGIRAVYWAQEDGRWVRRAESDPSA